METSPEIEDEDYADDRSWRSLDDTMVLVGLLLLQASLFKSGYSAELMTELQVRVAKLIKYYGRRDS